MTYKDALLHLLGEVDRAMSHITHTTEDVSEDIRNAVETFCCKVDAARHELKEKLMLRGIVLSFLCVVLAGCAGGLGYQGMSPEQITAAVKDKAAGISCVNGVYAGATVSAVFVNVDKGIPSGITIEQGCKVTFTSPAR